MVPAIRAVERRRAAGPEGSGAERRPGGLGSRSRVPATAVAQERQLCPGSRWRRGEEEELQLDGGSWRRSRAAVPCAREGAALSWLSRAGMTR